MKKMHSLSMGLHNLRHQSVRTLIMVLFSFIIAVSLFVSSILSTSMQECVDRTVDQMGADVIIVPSDYVADYSNAMFNGSLCSFYFENTWFDEIAAMDGVAQATSQLLIATLPADCCSSAVQVIAFDAQTDFIVKPWLTEINIDALEMDEVIVGSEFGLDIGDITYFFGMPFEIVGKLQDTGTEYDHCVFVNFDIAHRMLRTDILKDTLALADQEAPTESLISSIMLRLDDPQTAEDFALTLNQTLREHHLKALTPNQVVNSVAQSISSFSVFSDILSVLVFIIAVLAITCIFSITILQRKHEFGVIITLGASKSKLVQIILAEGILIGLLGGVVGVLCAGGVLFAFKDILLIQLGIPSLIADGAFYTTTALQCVGIATLAGIVASLVAIILLCRIEPLKLIQEGNA